MRASRPPWVQVQQASGHGGQGVTQVQTPPSPDSKLCAEGIAVAASSALRTDGAGRPRRSPSITIVSSRRSGSAPAPGRSNSIDGGAPAAAPAPAGAHRRTTGDVDGGGSVDCERDAPRSRSVAAAPAAARHASAAAARPACAMLSARGRG